MDQSSFRCKLSKDIIKYIDSRNGKDIKQYIQIAPYHMKIAGLSDNKVKLLCKLAELSKHLVTKTEYIPEDLGILERKIAEYLQAVTRIYPELANKVKTHLSTHITDDIQQHGPPSAYIEDAFEKLHGRIRDQIFCQNLHAVSRDTAIAFAEMEVLFHVSSGGYFQKNGEWVQASLAVQKTMKEKEIISYLGLSNTETTCNATLLKVDRSGSRKVIWKTVLEDDEIIKEAKKLNPHIKEPFQAANYRGLRCKNGDIVNSLNPVMYQDHQNQESNIGLFVAGYEVRSGMGLNIQFAELQVLKRDNMERSELLSSNRYMLTDNHVFVKPDMILQSVCLIHDCFHGSCHLKECFQKVKIEQEYQTIKTTLWHHTPGHRYYYLNNFRFTHP